MASTLRCAATGNRDAGGASSPATGVWRMWAGLDVLADTLIAGLVFATLAAAWSWLGSYAGILSFGHAVFFGIGGYAVAVSNFRGGSPWYGALGGALAAVAAAVLCGLTCVRGRGYTFALVHARARRAGRA